MGLLGRFLAACGESLRCQGRIPFGLAWLPILLSAASLAACQGQEGRGPALLDLARQRPALTILGAQAEDRLLAVAAGDVNGDGQQDVIVGAYNADGPRDDRPDCGEAYVILGPVQRGQTIDLAAGQQDVTIFGADGSDYFGFALAAGDINSDGIDDILVGAPLADGPANQRPDAGEAYVVLGSPSLGPTVDLALGEQRLTLFGVQEGDRLGAGLAIGDANGDGNQDILVGSFLADGPENARYQGGEAYLIFGSPSLSGTRDMARGDYDLALIGAAADDQLGLYLAMGDVNDDDIEDPIVAAFRADGPNDAREDGGEVYVIFGSPSLGGVLDLAFASPDLTVAAADSQDDLGAGLASADVNGDGIDDLLLGAPRADGPDNSRQGAGEAYVIFGSPTLGPALDIAQAEQDVTILGADPGDRLGGSVASGDIDGDGIEDIILGAEEGDGPRNDRGDAGELYIILGSPSLSPTVDIALGDYGAAAFGVQKGDAFGASVAAVDRGDDGRHDVLAVAGAADGPDASRQDAGEAYLIPVGDRLRRP